MEYYLRVLDVLKSLMKEESIKRNDRYIEALENAITIIESEVEYRIKVDMVTGGTVSI